MNYIEIYLFVVSFGYYLFNPIFSNLLFENFCVYRHGGILNQCRINTTLNQATHKDLSFYKEIKNWVLLLTTFISPMLANFISTKFYPERILVFPTIHFLISCVIGILYACFPKMNMYYLIPLYLVIDILGLSSTVRSLVSYYLVKTSKEENIQTRLVLADSAFILSLAFSGVIKGHVEETVGYLYSSVICLVLIVVAYLFSLFLERSTIKEQTDPITMKVVKQTAKDAYAAMKKYPFPFLTITIAQFFYPFAEVGAAKMINQYMNLSIIKITKQGQGYVLFALSLIRGIGSLILIPLLLKYLKCRHWVLCAVFLPFQLGFYIMFGLARSATYLYIAPTFFLFQDIYQPLFCYVMAKMFDGRSQAVLIAFHYGLGAFAKRLSGAVGQVIFSATFKSMPGFIFFLFGGIACASTLLGTIGSYYYLKATDVEQKDKPN